MKVVRFQYLEGAVLWKVDFKCPDCYKEIHLRWSSAGKVEKFNTAKIRRQLMCFCMDNCLGYSTVPKDREVVYDDEMCLKAFKLWCGDSSDVLLLNY